MLVGMDVRDVRDVSREKLKDVREKLPTHSPTSVCLAMCVSMANATTLSHVFCTVLIFYLYLSCGISL